MRRKRSPAISFLLRVETARRVVRVLTLLALDFAGLSLAIFTSLVLKAAVLSEVSVHGAYEETRSILAFAYLLTALLFARSGLYAAGAQRPGMTRIVASLFQVTFVAALFALVSGQHFQSYYIFWGSLVFALLYVPLLRYLYERATGTALRIAGHERRAVLVGTGSHIREVARALADAPHSRVNVVGYVSLRALPANGLRSLGTPRDLERVLAAERVDEVIIADPDFPQADAVELVDRCHQRGVRVRIAPSTMEILIHRAEFVPGESVPLFELKPPVFEGIDFALKRTFDVVGATVLLVLLSPLLAAVWVAVRATSRGPGGVPLGPPGHRGAAVRVPEVPHDVRGRRAPPSGPGSAQRGLGRAVQDPRRPAHDPGGPPAAALLAGRAAAAGQRAARGDVAGRARARCRSATSRSWRSGTASATWCSRASRVCGRSQAVRSSTSTTWCTSTSSTWSTGRWRWT